MRACALCKEMARAFCESDQASLCWSCDAKVHGANFLVARHSRTLLCHSCQSPTPWKASGPKLGGRTVSFCDSCLQRRDPEEGGGDNEDRDDTGDEEEEDDDDERSNGDESGGGGDEMEEDEEEDDDGAEEGDNQVVPWSSSFSTCTPPPPASCSSSEANEFSGRGSSSGGGEWEVDDGMSSQTLKRVAGDFTDPPYQEPLRRRVRRKKAAKARLGDTSLGSSRASKYQEHGGGGGGGGVVPVRVQTHCVHQPRSLI
ncbi:hypothetical protein MLD38_025824 [Melastoma candidum]|uniref:Uncharacterized protein n=1 Tax=Melastoma candidum TaxID=119954 RepID=A0ACB9NWN6_9MYRT|nr:hypothetical protein MLD38_025824 [Melastoma candidum]